MSKIYKNQTALRLQLTCSQDITGATALLIDYRRPDGTTGSFTATELTPTTGVIYYDVAESTDLNLSGKWRFWADVTFSDGRRAPGEVAELQVYEEGT